jgi:alkanesulfonate monooxygenase SsuD/methylene tetrahydromethanopterin reductase-like flavin-dependent oxidoreductase (luciferase family)
VDLYRRAGEEEGHDPASLHVTMSAIGLIAPRSQDAKEQFYPYWLATMKYGAQARGWAVPSRAHYDAWTTKARAIFAGSPDEVADRLITVGRLVGADRYGLQMDWAGVPHAAVMKAIELLGTEVLPQVRRELGAAADAA